MFSELDQLHLYLSKTSDIRLKINSSILEQIKQLIDENQFSEQLLDQCRDFVATHELYEQYQQQMTYAIIDILLVYYLNSPYFDEVVEYLKDSFREYILIHELAALAWGDKKVPSSVIFHRLNQSELSSKHIYHILNEMSTTFPKKTMQYVQDKIAEGKMTTDVRDKLIGKMIRDRTRDRPLAKNVVPQLTADQVKDLYL